MELNAETVKKALDWLDSLVGNSNDSDMAMFAYQLLGILYDTCEEKEQRIKELTEENAEVKANWQKLKDSYDNNDKEWREAYADSQSKWEKSYEKLELTLEGVMHFVDKWLDGAELEQDEVNRAITMREKTLQIVEKLTEENERLQAEITHLEGHREADIKAVKNLKAENERLRERNITLEQKLIILGCDEQYFFKPKVKGETANEN